MTSKSLILTYIMKTIASLTTNPIAVDDGESTNKEGKLVTSSFDRTKYQTKQGKTQNNAVYMVTSNVMFRCKHIIF